MRIFSMHRTGDGFPNGSAVWLSDGFDTGCSFVAARIYDRGLLRTGKPLKWREALTAAS